MKINMIDIGVDIIKTAFSAVKKYYGVSYASPKRNIFDVEISLY